MTRPALPRAAVVAVRLAFAALIASALVSGLAGGLLRAGVAWPGGNPGAWIGAATLHHAALMVCAFLGTVIGIERAVAVKARPAFLAPLASATAGLCLLAGADGAARVLFVGAALVFSAVNTVIVHRQRAAHTGLLLVSALAWLLGNLAFAAGDAGPATQAGWFAFLVLTIAAERLEMTRLMRRRPGAQPALFAIVALLLAGAALSHPAPRAGGIVYGAALAALALWLMAFDIARRTVTAEGLSRYMAICLLGGYGWLLIAGIAWAAQALGHPVRDAALHALGLGFVMSMVMGHGPVILPAVARIKVRFGWPFYVPLAALHLSLLLRLGPGAADAGWRALGALLNVAALALFAATMLGAAVAWHLAHGGKPARRRAP